MALEIQDLYWDRHTNVSGLNMLMGSQLLWIIASPTTVNKQKDNTYKTNHKKKTFTNSLPPKMTTAIIKMTGNINMHPDSTIEIDI